MQVASADAASREGTLREDLYYGRQIIKEKVDVKMDQIGLKYLRATAAIRNFLRFYGFISHIKYDGSPESFQLLVWHFIILQFPWLQLLTYSLP